MADTNLFTALYLHYFTVMQNYFYRAVFNVGNRAQYLLPYLHGNAFTNIVQRFMFIFQFNNVCNSNHFSLKREQ